MISVAGSHPETYREKRYNAKWLVDMKVDHSNLPENQPPDTIHTTVRKGLVAQVNKMRDR